MYLKDKLLNKLILLKDKFLEIKDKLIKLRDDFIQSILDLPGNIWDAIKGLAQMIADKIKGIFGFGGGTSVGDAIIRPNGEIIRTDPQDTLIATKTPDSVGGGVSKVFNIFGSTNTEIIELIKRELGVEGVRSTRF